MFINENDHICWHVDDDYASNIMHFSEIMSYFSHLLSRITPAFGEKKFIGLQERLGVVLYHILTDKEQQNKWKTSFSEIELEISKTRTIEESKIFFITLSIAYSLLFGIFGMILYFSVGYYSSKFCFYPLMWVSGCFGSCISILQRNITISPHEFSKDFYIHLQSLVILGYGGISGIILYLGIEGNIIFGAFNGNVYALLVLAMMSGFSERFIVDFMNNININDKKFMQKGSNKPKPKPGSIASPERPEHNTPSSVGPDKPA